MDQLIGHIMDLARYLVVLILTAVYPQMYAQWTGKVVEIIRADEIKVARNGDLVPVRFYGIDAPIWWKAQKPSGGISRAPSPHIGDLRDRSEVHRGPVPQDFGKIAVDYTTRRVLGKTVAVQPLPGTVEGRWYKPRLDLRDNQKRVQALVWVHGEGGECLNKELLRKGMAWWYKPFFPFERGLKHLEDEARKAEVGLWADPDSAPPWHWQGTNLYQPNPWFENKDVLAILAAVPVVAIFLLAGFLYLLGWAIRKLLPWRAKT